ncbi:hypothetical protein KJ819_01585 [Patescibacteria group bacterium]|nr:hypothetical protein [Patescibacteria group bacterium]MBU1501024.1 hypothetical protein [Patescibacteria group bacterium]MBU2080654.1 hypothetical protein [Patescibacteria group bacterium]MBU2124271.1 hypothetical protein [Patescibacteria group bacterium]MBU2194397.1 hypothetical protein [Patescibacteria group bacterium]
MFTEGPPPKAANDNEAPDTTSLKHETGPVLLDVGKERTLRNTIDEIARSGDMSLLNDQSIKEAKMLVSSHAPGHAIQAINNSTEAMWRTNPAVFVAYLDLIDSFKEENIEGN